jgi:hypothetical protein
METQVLKKELDYFESMKAKFLKEFPGKYVLIHDDTLVGSYDKQEDAYNEGYERFGAGPFLVKQVCDVEKTVHLACDVGLCVCSESTL